jgi:hypothetical protein
VWTRAPDRSPYTLRDARTGELLFRSSATDVPQQAHKVGAGRLLQFTVGGYSEWTERKIVGVEPWLSATVAGWFSPGNGVDLE